MSKREEPVLTMLDGKTISMINPQSEDIDFDFIIRGLNRTRRFNGETMEPWSVADHSILVHDIFVMVRPAADAKTRLCALLHDAHEAYLGDMICPVRDALAWLGSGAHDFEALKAQFDQAILGNIGIAWPLPQETVRLIHQADQLALAIEEEQLRGKVGSLGLLAAGHLMDQIRYHGRDSLGEIIGDLLLDMQIEDWRPCGDASQHVCPL